MFVVYVLFIIFCNFYNNKYTLLLILKNDNFWKINKINLESKVKP